MQDRTNALFLKSTTLFYGIIKEVPKFLPLNGVLNDKS